MFYSTCSPATGIAFAKASSICSFKQPLVSDYRKLHNYATSASRVCKTSPFARLGEKTLAIDYGSRRIGLATSVGIAPTPLPTILNSTKPEDVAALISSTARAHVCTQMLVGLPLETSGCEGSQVENTKRFVEYLISAAPWATIWAIDERYSSREARGLLWEKGIRGQLLKDMEDSYSAVVMLNRFFGDNEEVVKILHRGEKKASNHSKKPSSDRISYREWKQKMMERANEGKA